MDHKVLFKGNPFDQEFLVANRILSAYQSRMEIPENSIIIAKYGMWPYPSELQKDLEFKKSHLINSPEEYHFINNFWNWYEQLKEFTPKSYKTLEDLPDDKSFVLKGHTKSKKDKWFTDCFASDKEQARVVYERLTHDSYIMNQGGIVIREYVPLNFIGYSNNKIIKEEYRIFVYKGNIVSTGFYYQDEIPEVSKNLDESGLNFVKKVISKFTKSIPFYTIDIAKTETGDWILIELNEGQMATLMGNDPENVYSYFLKV